MRIASRCSGSMYRNLGALLHASELGLFFLVKIACYIGGRGFCGSRFGSSERRVVFGI